MIDNNQDLNLENLEPQMETKPSFFQVINKWMQTFKSNFEPLIRGKKWLLALLIMIPLFLLFVLVLMLTVKYLTDAIKVSPTPAPIILNSPLPSPANEIITNPSRYATDSGVLELEKRIKDLDENLGKVDLREPGINPPTLNFDIYFAE